MKRLTGAVVLALALTACGASTDTSLDAEVTGDAGVSDQAETWNDAKVEVESDVESDLDAEVTTKTTTDTTVEGTTENE